MNGKVFLIVMNSKSGIPERQEIDVAEVLGVIFEPSDKTSEFRVQSDEDSIEIFGNRAIVIEPDAANHIHIKSRV